MADLPAYTPGRTVPGAIKIASNETVDGPLPSVREAVAAAMEKQERRGPRGRGGIPAAQGQPIRCPHVELAHASRRLDRARRDISGRGIVERRPRVDIGLERSEGDERQAQARGDEEADPPAEAQGSPPGHRLDKEPPPAIAPLA
jgi:hypothetical protein